VTRPLPGPASPGTNFTPAARYPDPAFVVHDPAFAAVRVSSSVVEQLCTGLRWAEGPVWFGDGRYLLVSDIPNDRVLRWDECSGLTSVFRAPANFANGHARDAAGRLVTCEHGTRRVTRTEHDGRLVVLVERFEGRRLNSPNDITCHPDGSLWFSDPSFGIDSDWEGHRAPSENPHAVYRIPPGAAPGAEPQRMIEGLAAPNGLAFSPDGRVLYVVESRAKPHRRLWAWDVAAGDTPDTPPRLSNPRPFHDADDGGAPDGFAVDDAGRLWCGWGSAGSAPQESLDGVKVLDPDGRTLGHIHLPERCANLCFGGAKRNRLFMAASRSVYAVTVNARGVVG
jgi:gluconolactonase